MVHKCPSGKSFDDDKHQCLKQDKYGSADASLSNAKITKLTKKLVQFEHLIDAFKRKLEGVQSVIIESDNKIGLLGKFLLKALKQNRKNVCNTNDVLPSKQPEQESQMTSTPEPELQSATVQNEQIETTDVGANLLNEKVDQIDQNIPTLDVVATTESAQMSGKQDTTKVESSPKDSEENSNNDKSTVQQKTITDQREELTLDKETKAEPTTENSQTKPPEAVDQHIESNPPTR